MRALGGRCGRDYMRRGAGEGDACVEKKGVGGQRSRGAEPGASGLAVRAGGRGGGSEGGVGAPYQWGGGEGKENVVKTCVGGRLCRARAAAALREQQAHARARVQLCDECDHVKRFIDGFQCI